MSRLRYYRNQIEADKRGYDPIRWIDQYMVWSGVFDMPKTTEILDVGCGYGQTLKYLYKRGYTKLWGIDLNSNKLNKIDFNCTLVRADIHDLQFYFRPDTVDFIFSSHTLEHCYDPLEVLFHMHNILHPDGICMIIVPYPDQERHSRIHVGSKLLKINYDYAIHNRFGSGFLRILKRDIGFSIRKVNIVTKSEDISTQWKKERCADCKQDEIWVQLKKNSFNP